MTCVVSHMFTYYRYMWYKVYYTYYLPTAGGTHLRVRFIIVRGRSGKITRLLEWFSLYLVNLCCI